MAVKKVFLVMMLFSILNILGAKHVVAQVSDNSIGRLAERIDGVEKVDQLYSIRFTIAKYATREDLSLSQQLQLDKAMILLSDAFKNYNHFRNAADVYKERLDFNNRYLTRFNTFAKDSLIALYKSIEQAENNKIGTLDREIKELNDTRSAVSGLKQRYYTFGGIAAIGTIIISILIGLAKNRAIKDAETHIASNREKLLGGTQKFTEAGMLSGSINFCRDAATVNEEAISKILEATKQKEDKKLFQNEISALQNAHTSLNKLVTGTS